LERFLRDTQGLRLVWIEEPFREEADAFLRLKEAMARYHPEALLADGRTKPHFETLLELMRAGALDVLKMDIQSVGLTNWRELLPKVAETPGVLSPAAWGNPIKTVYAAHMAAVSDRAHSIEGVPGQAEGTDPVQLPLLHGEFLLPERPGFGWDLLWAQRL